jgi:hypothetical protein
MAAWIDKAPSSQAGLVQRTRMVLVALTPRHRRFVSCRVRVAVSNAVRPLEQHRAAN